MVLSKNIHGGYFCDDAAITEAEYNRIKSIIDNRPSAPEGYGYRLTHNLEWELYELPVEEPSEPVPEGDV